jgi:hypothetical protein
MEEVPTRFKRLRRKGNEKGTDRVKWVIRIRRRIEDYSRGIL